MTNRDTPSELRRFAAGDVLTAIALLTRIPVRANFTRGAMAAWAYPLAGLVLACVAGIITAVAQMLGVPPPLTAAMWLLAMVVLSGAMHEDGLADCADGFWGGWDSARRLEIMRDSRIGAYGVIALCLSLIARWAALTLVIAQANWFGALIAVAVLSRASMVVLMHLLPNARTDGLSRAQGRPDRHTALAAAVLSVLLGLLASGADIAPLLVMAALATSAVGAIARSKIGGQTGDVLGATQQAVEITLLLTLTALI